MKCLVLLAAAMSLIPACAFASTHSKTQTLQVRGSVTQDCTLTTYPMTFPNVGVGYLHPKGNTVLAQSSLGMRCTKGSSVQISMNAGLYGSKAGVQFGSRSMKSSPGKSYLGYDLCHDSACASIWSSSAAFGYTSPSDAGSSLPVWGRIITGQQVDAGSYSDSVTVTVNF